MLNRFFVGICCLTIFSLGACKSALYYTKQGNKKFKMGEYDFATQMYINALSKGGQKDYLNYKMAESYRLSNRLAEASPYYQKVVDANAANDTAYFYHALSLKEIGSYEPALKRFKAYLKVGNNDEYRKRAKLEIKALEDLSSLMKKECPFRVKNATYLNTKGADYGAVLFDGGLAFTSTRGQSKLYRANGLGFSDIWRFKFDGNGHGSGYDRPFPTNINLTDNNEGSPTFTPDGSIMVFARSNDGSKKGRKETDLYLSTHKGGNEWSDPILLDINDDNAWTSTPMFSPDGKTLYFSSNRKGGYGGIDLYKANFSGDTSFTNVTNLGSKINTAGNELFPYLAPNGRFYFSSDGQPGIGGLDIFVAKRDSNSKAMTIENVGMPANSKMDDFGIFFDTDTTGYLSSNREGGKGDDDIYEFNYKPVYKVIYYIDGKTIAVNRANQEIGLTNVLVKFLNANKELIDSVITADGTFTFPLEVNKDYFFQTQKEGYFTKTQAYSTFGKSVDKKLLKEGLNIFHLDTKVIMDSIELNKAIVLENIYYDYNKTEIRADAAKELDKLVTILKQNRAIKIELSSHTDSRGSDDFNMKLSQGRAESAVAYIISKGIAKERITAKGYGETKLLVSPELNEDDMQRNRRTEFKVTGIIQSEVQEYKPTAPKEEQNVPSEEEEEDTEEEEAPDAPQQEIPKPAEEQR